MAKYIIIEDEQLAYNELKRMMMTVRPDWELCGWASSVEQAIILIKSTAADLLLVDIRLSDGDSFEIFDRIKTSVPVIFTTAYDEFALKAFKLNSIDYLLKPIEETDLEAALQKYESLRAITPESDSYAQFRNYYLSPNLKNRFLVQCGDIYQHIETRDVAFFYSEEKYNYLHTFSGRRYIIDYTIDRLESILDPARFFRVSRGCIVNIDSIKKVSKYFTGRLKLEVYPDCPTDITVPRNRVKEFFNWMDGVK